MSGALVRGGVGSEIALRDILPAHLRSGLATRSRTEPIAREYEAAHPGAVVVCDWELFDDVDIAAMSEQDRQQALTDRQALVDRRAAAVKMPPPEDPARGGDPDRARELLRRARNEMHRLPLNHVNYKNVFPDLARQINQLEDAVGEPRTEFKVGMKFESGHKLPEAKQKELLEKVRRYTSLPIANRKASIEKATDPILTQMLFDVEIEKDLRDLLALKLTELNALVPA